MNDDSSNNKRPREENLAERIKRKKMEAEARGTPAPQMERSVPKVSARAGKRRAGIFGQAPPIAVEQPAPQQQQAVAQPTDAAIEALVDPETVKARQMAASRTVYDDHMSSLLSDDNGYVSNDSRVSRNPLFANGVKDVEWWDASLMTLPSYDMAQVKPEAVTDLLHLPVPKLGPAVDKTVEIPKLVKTPAEIRAERKKNRKEAQEEHRRKVQSGDIVEKTRHRVRDLQGVLKDQHALEPTKIEAMVKNEIDERELAHQRQNYDRHVAALPNQIAKKDSDKERVAKFGPRLGVFVVHPLREPHTIDTIKIKANDRLLRGRIYHVGGMTAVVVLVGGCRPMREMEHYLTRTLPNRLTSKGAHGTLPVAGVAGSVAFEGHTETLDAFTFDYGGAQKASGGDAEDEATRQFVYVESVEAEAMVEKFSRPGLNMPFLWDNVRRVLQGTTA